MDNEERPGDIRDIVRQMLESAEFYADLIDKTAHNPTCWKLHTACALRRVAEILDGETEDEDDL